MGESVQRNRVAECSSSSSLASAPVLVVTVVPDKMIFVYPSLSSVVVCTRVRRGMSTHTVVSNVLWLLGKSYPSVINTLGLSVSVHVPLQGQSDQDTAF